MFVRLCAGLFVIQLCVCLCSCVCLGVCFALFVWMPVVRVWLSLFDLFV